MSAEAFRKSMITKIHLAKSQLGMSDDDYRALLLGLFRAGSSTKLSTRQLDQLLRHFETLGWRPRTTKVRKGDKPPSERALRRTPMLSKVEALLAELANLQSDFVPWDYASSILQRMYKVERLEWAAPYQLRGVIAALNRRVGVLARRAAEAEDARADALRMWQANLRQATGLRETV